MKEFWELLATKHHLGIVTFIVLVLIVGKMYDLLFSKSVHEKITKFTDSNKKIMFDVFISGLIFFALGLIIKPFVGYPDTWFLCSSFLIVGGMLGIMPFSFTKKK